MFSMLRTKLLSGWQAKWSLVDREANHVYLQKRVQNQQEIIGQHKAAHTASHRAQLAQLRVSFMHMHGQVYSVYIDLHLQLKWLVQFEVVAYMKYC